MRRSASTIALLLVAAVLAACAVPQDAASETTPAPAATASPTPTPTPTLSLAPGQPAASDPDDPSTWLLTNDAVGPYQLGMPFADSLAVASGFEDACGYAYFREFDPAIWQGEVWIAERDDKLFVVMTGDPDGPRTAEGIGVGSTTADVIAAYPDAVVVYRNLPYLRSGNLFFGFRSDVMYPTDPSPYQDGGVPEEIVTVGATTWDQVLWEFCG